MVLSVVRPVMPISSKRIGSITKTELVRRGLPEGFTAHASRGMGLDLLHSWGLEVEKSCEIGLWKKMGFS